MTTTQKTRKFQRQGRTPAYSYFHNPVKVFLAKLPDFLAAALGGALFAAFMLVLFVADCNEEFRLNLLADIRCLGLAALAGYLFVRFAICTNLFGTNKKQKRER